MPVKRRREIARDGRKTDGGKGEEERKEKGTKHEQDHTETARGYRLAHVNKPGERGSVVLCV